MAHGIALQLREITHLTAMKFIPCHQWGISEKRAIRRRLEKKYKISGGRQWIKLRKALHKSGVLSV